MRDVINIVLASDDNYIRHVIFLAAFVLSNFSNPKDKAI